MGFEKKAVLVTGGTSGIGREAVLELARRGANVVFTGRRREEGESLAREAARPGVKVVFVQGDVSDESHLARAVETAASIGGGQLHMAFNNAGLELGGVPITESSAEQYRRIFDVNVLGVLLSLKHEMHAMSGGASIVNNASVAGRIGMPGVGIYIASKHAVLGLTKTAALEGAPRGIRVNAVSPGAVATEMFERFTGGSREAQQQFTSLHPIGRFGTPSEIVKATLFLLSDDASFITGHDLVADGGLTVP